MPFKLESFSAPRTKVVHVHHHHYSDSVNDSSEDVYDEDDMASYDSDDVFALDQMMDSSLSNQTESIPEIGH